MLLIFTACLLASPVDCRNERVVLDATPMQCLIQAQPVLAGWQGDHPDKRIANYRCVRPDRLERRA